MEKACPKCGQSDHFQVIASAVFRVNDEGAEQDGDLHWDGDSFTRCPSCEWKGAWKELKEAEP